ncbi:C-type lectin 37Db-like [Drosophila bipectinata]|uniref:C-type lectin 37Db-like n=1 Tax=Drosophila bipectinata TaxID=42026 RepID=UPI001C8AF61F|nr:C-type lectin 37Db-like [Drosophila bipectinata]
MLKLASFILLALIASDVASSEEDPLKEQCAGYCFHAIQPMMDYLTGRQDTKLMQTQAKLEHLEHQLASLPRNEASTKFRPLPTYKVQLPNYVKIGEKSYYIEEREKIGFFDAANLCRQMGGDLVSLQSMNEMKALTEHLSLVDYYWTDINEWGNPNSYEYRSLTTGFEPNFIKWAPGRPNHAFNEHCVVLKNNTMIDKACHEKMYFICQSRD